MTFRLFPKSLRDQLLFWIVVPGLVLWIATGVWVYYFTKRISNASYDYNLATTVLTLASKIETVDGKVVVNFPTDVIKILRETHIDDRYYKILGPNGEIISGDPKLPSPPSISDQIEFSNAYYEKEIRQASLRVPIKESNGQYVTIQVAETLSGREMLVSSAQYGIIAAILFAVFVAAGKAWFGIQRGLLPIRKFTEAVEKSSSKELVPLDEKDVPREIKPLILAINGLLARLAEDLLVQRRFIANAAHQLRTPLAGLKAQTDIALRDNNLNQLHPELQLIHSGIERVSRIVKQLLSLARAEPEALASGTFQILDFRELVKQVCCNLAPYAINHEIDFGYEGSEQSIFLRGNTAALTEMIENVVENAIRYTPSGGTVTVKLATLPKIELIVEDNGPGIPPSEQAKVFERFYRIPGTKATGSGLGLAIVSEIARAHNATVKLGYSGEQRGTRICITFDQSDAHYNIRENSTHRKVLVKNPDTRDRVSSLRRSA